MIISRTPMRVSLMGGGSDLSVYYHHGYGAVVGTALDRYVYITVNRKFDDMIRVSYSKTEMVASLDELEHNIIREALRKVGIEKGVEVVYMADIPLGGAGVGLGSSSSLAVGVLNALYAYKGEQVSAERLASEACEIEIELLGHPIGKQDQYLAAYGGINYVRFNSDESVFVDPVICTPETKKTLQDRFLLFYTGITRFSTDVLSEQKRNIDNNYRHLNKLVEMCETMRDAIIHQQLHLVGELLHEGWMHKKQLARSITNGKIDSYYERAIDAGATGGKLLGAGGGGFLLFYCEPEKQNQVRAALPDLKFIPMHFEPQGSKIIYVSD